MEFMNVHTRGQAGQAEAGGGTRLTNDAASTAADGRR